MPLVSSGFILDEGIEDRNYEIILGSDDLPLICSLTMVDLKTNANKFMVIHALRNNIKNTFEIYTRSGRTGNPGKSNYKLCKDLEDCKSHFYAKFKKETANVWTFRDRFQHRMGHYGVFSFGEKESKIDQVDLKTEEKEVSPDESKDILPEEINYIIQLFCEIGLSAPKIKAALCEMEIDQQKMPVGAVGKRNIQLARDILDQLCDPEITESQITRLSEKYYGFIPFISGNRRPPLINSVDEIKRKLQILDDLENITITANIVSGEEIQKDNHVDVRQRLYDSMNHSMRLLNRSEEAYNVIERYFKITHVHWFKLILLRIYEVHNPDKKATFEKYYGDSTRRELLIHGSRIANWRSILQNGLVLNPSKFGAIITGKMFGNGIYFANSFSKSAQYCGDRRHHDGIICLALAEVAVGNPFKARCSGNYCVKKDNNPEKHEFVWGLGRNTPGNYVTLDGMHVPSDRLIPSKEVSCAVDYDEMIIFDTNQYNFRYLVFAKMN